MGWLFIQNYTRRDLIDHLVRFQKNEHGTWNTLRHCTRGNVLWAVVEVTRNEPAQVEKFIACILLQKSVERHEGHKTVSWGYKDMSESMGPCYYTCPKSYLEDVPVANESWRQKVKDYHRKYQVGDVLILAHSKIPQVKVASVRPLIGIYEGTRYRVPRGLVHSVVQAA